MLPSIDDLYGRKGVELGSSPFRIKGFGYTQHYRWVEEHLPGGLAAQDEALGQYWDHGFFADTTYYASTFYDVFPLVLLGHACASVVGMTSHDFVHMRSRFQAEQDIRYIRKWIIRLASPMQVARRLPSVATAYFDFGRPESVASEEGLDGQISGIPKALTRWLIPVIEGFSTYALEVNGALDISVRSYSIPSHVTHKGFQTATITNNFRWK